MSKRVYTRRWTDADLKRATEISTSIRQILRHLSLVPAGGNYAQIHKYFGLLNIDASHLKGCAWNRGLKGTSRTGVPLDKILVNGIFYQSHRLKRRLIAAGMKPAFCEECGWSKRTEDGYLPLEIHHINGDPKDNRLVNLQVLCPNCHSLRPHYRARNRKSVRLGKSPGGGTGDTLGP